MIEELLTDGEIVKLKLSDEVYITNKRILQYRKSILTQSFKDLSLKFLESISYEKAGNILFLIIGAIGFIIVLTLGLKLNKIEYSLFSIVWLLVFIFLFEFFTVQKIKFIGNNTKMRCKGDFSKIKEIRDLYEKYK